MVSKCCRRRFVQLQPHSHLPSCFAKVSYNLMALLLLLMKRLIGINVRLSSFTCCIYPRRLTRSSSTPLLGLKFAWITIFLFDILVFALTLMRTYRLIKAHAGLQMKSSLAMLVVRDGQFILSCWFHIDAHTSSIRQLLLFVRKLLDIQLFES